MKLTMKLLQLSISDSQDKQDSGNDDFLAAHHRLPKTKISHAILHDNMSQERLLRSRKQILERRSNYHRQLADRTKKNFVTLQTRKRGKWKREDDVRINCLNLPMITNNRSLNRPPSMTVVYNSPNYDGNDNRPEEIYVPLRPVMGIKKEKTEIVYHRSKMAVSRLPAATQIDQAVLDKYDRYRGARFLAPGVMYSDPRFLRCERLLSELRVVTPQLTTIPSMENNDRGPVAKFGKNRQKGFLLSSTLKEKTSLPILMTGTNPYLTRCMSRKHLTKV